MPFGGTLLSTSHLDYESQQCGRAHEFMNSCNNLPHICTASRNVPYIYLQQCTLNISLGDDGNRGKGAQSGVYGRKHWHKQNKHILIFQLLGYTERQILWHCWYPRLLSPFFAMEYMGRGGWCYTVHAGHTILAVVTDRTAVKLDANNNSHHWWWPPWWLS